MRWAAIVGLLSLAAAIVIALFMARRIAQPIVRLSRSASRIADLDIANVPTLPSSLFRELNDQARAFNTMLAGLRWFEVYVPKTLVRRLMHRTEGGSIESTERELTVLFTDIAGFTGLAEGTDAAALAAFLNHHFALIARAVEAEGGTVDKFIGDAVMAFWGAPDVQDDHAERACRAALGIVRAIDDDNARRAAAGRPEVVVRIGIHTGPAVVGNIGAPGRMNYTIVGDTVNVAQRLEQLGKEVARDGAGTNILVSGETRAALGPGFDPRPAGMFQVKGRADSVSVFRLGSPPE